MPDPIIRPSRVAAELGISSNHLGEVAPHRRLLPARAKARRPRYWLASVGNHGLEGQSAGRDRPHSAAIAGRLTGTARV